MRAVGIILDGGNSRKMKELTSRRAAAAMPVAGSYRAIDFINVSPLASTPSM